MNKLSDFLVETAALLPPALLLLRWTSPRRLPWWLMAVITVFGVWGLTWLSEAVYYHHAMQLLNEFKGGNPPREMIDDATTDSAFSFVCLYGFGYGPVLALPWLLLYAGAAMIAGRSRRNGPRQLMGQPGPVERGGVVPPAIAP